MLDWSDDAGVEGGHGHGGGASGGGGSGGGQVRQSACFALATSAFDAECRTEIRMKEGLRALALCLGFDESRVQVPQLLVHRPKNC